MKVCCDIEVIVVCRNFSLDLVFLCADMLEGTKSPSGPSPPPQMGSHGFGDKPFFHPFPINKDNLTHGAEHSAHGKNFTPIVSALFQNSALEKSGNACECRLLW